MIAVMDVKIRLHIDPHMEEAPVSTFVMASPLPPTLLITDELTGIDVIYSLRRRHLPGTYDPEPASADYVWKGLA